MTLLVGCSVLLVSQGLSDSIGMQKYSLYHIDNYNLSIIQMSIQSLLYPEVNRLYGLAGLSLSPCYPQRDDTELLCDHYPTQRGRRPGEKAAFFTKSLLRIFQGDE